MVKSKSRISAKIIIQSHTKTSGHRLTQAQEYRIWSWSVNRGLIWGQACLCPSLISAHLWWCDGLDTDGLLSNSVISVAPVWKLVRATGRLPSEGD